MKTVVHHDKAPEPSFPRQRKPTASTTHLKKRKTNYEVKNRARLQPERFENETCCDRDRPDVQDTAQDFLEIGYDSRFKSTVQEQAIHSY